MFKKNLLFQFQIICSWLYRSTVCLLNNYSFNSHPSCKMNRMKFTYLLELYCQSNVIAFLQANVMVRHSWITQTSGLFRVWHIFSKNCNSLRISICYNVTRYVFSYFYRTTTSKINVNTDLLLEDKGLLFSFCFLYLLEPTVIRLFTVAACNLILRVSTRLWLVATQWTFQKYFLVFTLLLIWK